MKEYNGHRSWNAWNVSLWLGGDEYYYDKVSNIIKHVKRNWIRNILSGEVLSKEKQIGIATSMMFKQLNGRDFHYDLKHEKTPDGACFNRLSIKLFIEDMFDNID